MKKFFALALITILTLSLTTTAFAATYRYDGDDIIFTYDENLFEIVEDDHTDDEDSVVLAAKDETWGQTYVRIYVADLDDGEGFPTMEDFAAMPDTTVEQMETWAGFKNVFTYTLENDDDTTQTFFIAPVYDDDGEIEECLTVEIGVTKMDDADKAMLRDDAISEILNTLKVDD